MSAALKVIVSKMTSSEKFLADAQKDGRATLQDVGMDHLEPPDVSLQGRTEIDMGWVRQLDEAYERNGEIEPIVVFWDEALGKYHLADGFHRHAFHKARRLPSIRAWVIVGTYAEAALYATSANQRGCLPRKEVDFAKILSILFGVDPAWIDATVAEIQEQVGIGKSAIRRGRNAYRAARGIAAPPPQNIAYKPGEMRLRTKTRAGRKVYQGVFCTGNALKRKFFGTDLEAAKQMAEAWAKDQVAKAQVVAVEADQVRISGYRLRDLLLLAGIPAETCAKPRGSGLGQAVVGETFLAVTPNFEGGESIVGAAGKVWLNSVAYPGRRPFIVSRVAVPDTEAFRRAQSLGVEFVTPEELVARLKLAGDQA